MLLHMLCWPTAHVQAETSRQLAAITAAESEALAAALSRKMQVQEASSKEVQRLREESAELRE
jgi:prophage DNA circulation protein